MTEAERRMDRIRQVKMDGARMEVPRTSATFGFRMVLAILLFILFLAFDKSGEKIVSVDSQKIVHEIERKVDIKAFHLI